MNKKFLVQIIALLLVSTSLSYMFVETDVYEETYSRIVSVICLSCIKLNRIYSADYQFDTANGKMHPDFIIEDLKEGPVFLSFRTDVCEYCDDMEPLIMEIFNISFEKEDVFSEPLYFNDEKISFYHINKDHANQDLKTLQPFYDIDGDNAVPMFTIITLGYDKGIIKPQFITFYGILEITYTDEQRIDEITNHVVDSLKLYSENRPGFIPEEFKK